jgi:Bacterial pre-peptidase C-terminal domain
VNQRKIRFKFILLVFLSLLLSISIATKTIATDIVSDDLGCTQFQDNTPNYCTDLDKKSGILIEQSEETQNPDRSTTLNLKVFNTGAAAALIEVYDANKRLRDIQTIDGSVPPTGLFSNGLEILDTPRLLLSNYGLFDARSRLKEQRITVNIPSGGSVIITKSSHSALLYNALLLGLETLKFTQGDPNFLKNSEIQNPLIEFIKELGQEVQFNIFTGTPSIESGFLIWSYIDKDKLTNILHKFFEYLFENDPSSNVFFQSFLDVGSTVVNYGLEEAIIAKLHPGLGELARLSRLTGDALNLSARAYNLYFSYIVGLSGKGTITLRGSQPMATERPVDAQGRMIQTWQEFVDQENLQSQSHYFDFDFPSEFRNGLVYWMRGADNFTAYIFKQGLASYPSPLTRMASVNISPDVGGQYVQSGQAIELFAYAGGNWSDIEVRFYPSGVGCFRAFCLEAPFMTDSEIRRILMSGRPMGESFILNERGRLENGDTILTGDGSLFDLYTFEGQRGQLVKISVVSPEFDTYLLLLDPDENDTAANDDAQQNNTNSYIEVTLPKTGTYTVVVNGYDSNSRGNYLLTITSPDRSISSAGELESTSKPPETTPDRVLERAIKATRLAQETIASSSIPQSHIGFV